LEDHVTEDIRKTVHKSGHIYKSILTKRQKRIEIIVTSRHQTTRSSQ